MFMYIPVCIDLVELGAFWATC